MVGQSRGRSAWKKNDGRFVVNGGYRLGRYRLGYEVELSRAFHNFVSDNVAKISIGDAYKASYDDGQLNLLYANHKEGFSIDAA